MVLAMILLISGIGVYYSYSQTPIYESTANFVVNPTLLVSETGDVLYSLDTLASRTTLATTYANILGSRTTMKDAVALMNISPAMTKDYTLSTVVLPDSNVIQLTVRGSSPDLAADLANAVGKMGEQRVKNLQEIYELRLVDTAIPDYEPVSPNHPVDITLSVMVGIAGGLAFITLREILAQTLEQSSQKSAAGQSSVVPISPLDPIPVPPVAATDTAPSENGKSTIPPSKTAPEPKDTPKADA